MTQDTSINPDIKSLPDEPKENKAKSTQTSSIEALRRLGGRKIPINRGTILAKEERVKETKTEPSS